MQVQVDRGKIIQIYEGIRSQIESLLYENDKFGEQIMNKLLDSMNVDISDNDGDVQAIADMTDKLYGVLLNKLSTDELTDSFIDAMR